jgi:hypothetical protein
MNVGACGRALIPNWKGRARRRREPPLCSRNCIAHTHAHGEKKFRADRKHSAHMHAYIYKTKPKAHVRGGGMIRCLLALSNIYGPRLFCGLQVAAAEFGPRTHAYKAAHPSTKRATRWAIWSERAAACTRCVH